tara:strand:- start:110 stop:1444 length:1335 start_codon:yes stop_codon:yes gene_type:complete
MPYDEYLDWSEQWLNECARLLSDNGSIYVAINDDYAAELTLIMKRLGLHMRNWIIWYYTFGQAMSKKFSRSHTHILYFTKDKKDFIFNADDIRVESVRQKIGDKRANPKGKVPDDVWKISRVAGTFKERLPGLPTQLPIELLQRVVAASSNPDSIVFDPFCGSGTTPYVAKQMGRKYIATELSQTYRDVAVERVGLSDREEKIKLGSDTAKGGFNNEKDVVEMFNSWKKNAFAQQWLNKLGYNLKEIEEVKARILSGYKTDVQVVITNKSGVQKNENLQVKLVSNKRGFNQIDKRWINKYKELWNFNSEVEELLKKFTGEIKPSGETKNQKRMFLTEFSPYSRELLIDWFKQNRRLVVSDILKGRGEYSASWMLVIQNVEGNYTWILDSMGEILQKMGLDGDVKVSPRGSLYIGKITMQRKGGDGGRPSANMLQFKINPIDLLD